MTAERIEEIKRLSEKSDIYERLAHALGICVSFTVFCYFFFVICYFISAPSIYEHEDIKKGILCQLFGGTSKDATNAGRGKFRQDIYFSSCSYVGMCHYYLLLEPRSTYCCVVILVRVNPNFFNMCIKWYRAASILLEKVLQLLD